MTEDFAPTPLSAAIDRLAELIDRLRPRAPEDTAAAEARLRDEIARLRSHPDEAGRLVEAWAVLLALPYQSGFYAETGVRSAVGFWLELSRRIGRRVLPKPPDLSQLGDVLQVVFPHPQDHFWIAAVDAELWQELITVLWPEKVGAGGTALGNILEAVRMISYRLAGTALDRELLHAEPSLERYESPFIAQNAALVPLLERTRGGGDLPSAEEVREIDVLLDQCVTVLDRVRRKATEKGINIRLSYLLARMRQLIGRLRELLDFTVAENQAQRAVQLMKPMIIALQTRNEVTQYVAENIALLARNVTDHASRHGEHYIAADRSEWWAMGRSAAGGGIIIALMAMIKLQLSLNHLPPLTEGIVYGLNYGIGFALIHLLGFTVATKQPAMTAASMAATMEDFRPRELERLGNFAQNVVRTQTIAVLGNVGLAIPVACCIAVLWPFLFGAPIAPPEKIAHMLAEIHPLESGALFYAAVAGVGLFLSGLVSGYFDNQSRYHDLPARIVAAPLLASLGAARTARLGEFFDAHYGAIIGNLFFGMYLGLLGEFGNLLGLPIDIRHVAFSSANLGAAMPTMAPEAFVAALPWALTGIIGIAIINLAVSFNLALYVAMKSRGLGFEHILRLGAFLLKRFVRQPLTFLYMPRENSGVTNNP